MKEESLETEKKQENTKQKEPKRINRIIYRLVFILVSAVVIYFIMGRGGNNNMENGDKNYSEATKNVYKVGYINVGQEDNKIIISNYNDFKDYFTKYTDYVYDGEGKPTSGSSDEILNKYEENFFENKSLAVEYVAIGSGSASVEYENAIFGENSILIKYKIVYPEIGTADMSGYFIVVEIDKHITSII